MVATPLVHWRTEQLIQPQTGCGSKFKPEIAAGTDMLTVVPATFTFLGILKIDPLMTLLAARVNKPSL